MTKWIKRSAAVLLAMATLFSLTACGADLDGTLYVKGLLDTTYLNDSAAYLQTVNTTEEEAAAVYENNISTESDFFLSYFGIGEVSEDVHDEIMELYKKIYAKSSYEVSETKKVDSDYTLTVTINPIDIINKNYDAIEEKLQQLVNESSEAGYEDETAFNDALAKAALEILNGDIAKLGYESPVTVDVILAMDSSRLYGVDSETMEQIDTAIIGYSLL